MQTDNNFVGASDTHYRVPDTPKPLSGPIIADVTGRKAKKSTKKRTTSGRRMRLSRLIDTRVIYCGDNLAHLQKLPDACIDLIYIDPPFNSNKNYEVFWGEHAERRAFEDRHESIRAYLDFMRPRCIELSRVLKPTGSFYYHCDWHASHYIKMILDDIFGYRGFLNEVIWKRQSSHNDARQGAKHFGRVHDTLFLYVSDPTKHTFNHQFQRYSYDYVEKHYRHIEPETGRRYSLGDITAPGGAAPSKGNPKYEFLGVARYWRFSEERMKELYAAGQIVQTKPGRVPRQKRYLDEQPGVPLGTVWDDIKPVHGSSRERVGYPTQKPVPLMERIIKTSSNEGDIVLDAFCGCGTTLEAAEMLGRQWIGIDISPAACNVMAKRLRDRCMIKQDEQLWQGDRGFVVRDLPWTEDRLRSIPPYEFENWAVIALQGVPNKIKVRDKGIDGRIFPIRDVLKETKGASGEQLEFTLDMWYPVQVKQKAKVGRIDIDAFETAMQRVYAKKGFFVGFDYTRDALLEIRRFKKETGCEIIALTVSKILEEEEKRRLA